MDSVDNITLKNDYPAGLPAGLPQAALAESLPTRRYSAYKADTMPRDRKEVAQLYAPVLGEQGTLNRYAGSVKELRSNNLAENFSSQ